MSELTSSPIYSIEWPAPAKVKAFSSYRFGGFSHEPYNSFNLAQHVGDNAEHVENNRQLLSQLLRLPEAPRWLNQTHSNHVINSENWQDKHEADAIISKTAQQVCSILTADCLPILVCNKEGNAVAAIHAGWRGLATNIIENTIKHFPASTDDILVWLGPAIGPKHFEVGHDVYRAFTHHNMEAKKAFIQTDQNHFLADIYLLTKQRLAQLGVDNIWGENKCTVSEPDKFFSYRRDNTTGRMASLIWFEP